MKLAMLVSQNFFGPSHSFTLTLDKEYTALLRKAGREQEARQLD